MKEFSIKPVAEIKNGYNEKFGVPRQSGLAPEVTSEIIFLKEFSDENLIRDIEQYSAGIRCIAGRSGGRFGNLSGSAKRE